MPNIFGTSANQAPLNSMLGNLAFQDKAFVSVDNIGIGTTAADTGTAGQTLQNYGGAFISGSVGIGTTNPTTILEVAGEITSGRVNTTQEGGQINFKRAIDNATAYSIDCYNDVGLGLTPRMRFIDNVAGAERMAIDKAGNILVGAGASTGTSSQPFQVNGGAYVSGNVGVGTTIPGAKFHIIGGTTAAGTAPFEISRGSLLTSIEPDVFEYDGVALFHTGNDTTNGHGRSIIPEVQYFRLGADGAAITATTTGAASTAGGSWFGATRRPSLVSGYSYEFMYHCAYTKASNGTLTFQFTASSGSITDIEAVVLPATGGQVGAYVQTGTGTTVACTATAQINAGTTGILIVSGLVIPGANMKLDLQLFQSAGTTTPKRGSWYKFNVVGIGNTIGNIG